MSYRHDPWFAGYVDGEGCFSLHETKEQHEPRYKRPYCTVRFSVGARSDEKPLLLELQSEFGGCVYEPYTRNIVQWHMLGKANCGKLVEYFDEFPLRSKKRFDYAIWRQAYMILIDPTRSRQDPELWKLRSRLMEERKFQKT